MASVTRDGFLHLVAPLIGMEVSSFWQGYGSTLCVDLGRLVPVIRFGRRRRSESEASFMLEWNWRLESDAGVIIGAMNSCPLVEAALSPRVGLRVRAVGLEGVLPELVVEFSDGTRLRSFAPIEGDELQWTVFLRDGSWLHYERGEIRRKHSSDKDTPSSFTDEERLRSEIAENASQRWGARTTAATAGNCGACVYWVPLDGPGHFLDYGVCSCGESVFDGRVVAFRSGCAAFSPQE